MTCPTAWVLSDDGYCFLFDTLDDLEYSCVLLCSLVFSLVLLGPLGFSWVLLGQNPTPVVGVILGSLRFVGVLVGFF